MLAFLQFDAPSVDLIEKMLVAGRLPTLSVLRKRGTLGPLEVSSSSYEAAITPSSTRASTLQSMPVLRLLLFAAEPAHSLVARDPQAATVWERLRVPDAGLWWSIHIRDGRARAATACG